LCRVNDQLRVDADPRFAGPELADELQRPLGRPPRDRKIGPAGSASPCGLPLVTMRPSRWPASW